MDESNPFALVRASEYTDEQINSLWVEIGAKAVAQIIEPHSRHSKYILGGKGTGKTHLLRYHSYAVTRLRFPEDEGIEIVRRQRALCVFLRASGVDPLRFAVRADSAWQQLFGVYLELRLGEAVLDALCDVKSTSPHAAIDDGGLIGTLAGSVTDQSIQECQSIEALRDWVIDRRRQIDRAVNNSAFSGIVEIGLPFSVGALCLQFSAAIAKWTKALTGIPLVYLIDEIENFNEAQQQVINSLIRYAEQRAAFRISGRLYSRKTLATMANGEENREGAEFTTVVLDDILRAYRRYPEFAAKFVERRLSSAGFGADRDLHSRALHPSLYFEEISTANYYSTALSALGITKSEMNFVDSFLDTMRASDSHGGKLAGEAERICEILTAGFPILIQKLNILLFCKRLKRQSKPIDVGNAIRADARAHLDGVKRKPDPYATAYGHYAGDLFAQLCRESSKAIGVPYAGFDTLVKMSSGNPRNLLILLGRAYAIATFRGIEFAAGERMSVQLQTEAALEAARFVFEADTNYGSESDLSRESVSRLATLLRTARFSLSIPEVSPLAVSFAEEALTAPAKQNLLNALNYSLLFEIRDGRPDRNSERLNRKIQLNPLLSPRWSLSIGLRGDLSLSPELANAIFAPGRRQEFDVILRELSNKWNRPFGENRFGQRQADLFVQ